MLPSKIKHMSNMSNVIGHKIDRSKAIYQVDMHEIYRLGA